MQTTFTSPFSWIRITVFWYKFHWSMLPKVQWIKCHYWFRLWIDSEQPTIWYLNQWRSGLLMHICVNRSRFDECWETIVQCLKLWSYWRFASSSHNSPSSHTWLSKIEIWYYCFRKWLRAKSARPLIMVSLEISFIDILIKIQLLYRKMNWKMSSMKCRWFCLELNVHEHEKIIFYRPRG